MYASSRAIVWLQNRREATMERSRPSSAVRRDDPAEFRVGRLKHERVKVPRGDDMMDWAERVMAVHADRKSVLEVSRLLSVYSLERCFTNLFMSRTPKICISPRTPI